MNVLTVRPGSPSGPGPPYGARHHIKSHPALPSLCMDIDIDIFDSATRTAPIYVIWPNLRHVQDLLLVLLVQVHPGTLAHPVVSNEITNM